MEIRLAKADGIGRGQTCGGKALLTVTIILAHDGLRVKTGQTVQTM